jgi:hypothetical protein
MACLRFLSCCPCPRCLLLKSHIPMIGTKTDTKKRIKLAHVDSQDRQDTIELVRKMMFEGGVNITSGRIETFLRPESLVPTRVGFWLFIAQWIEELIIFFRMHSQKDYLNMGSIFMRCSHQTYFMNLNWVSGRLYSPIYFESCIHVGKTKFRF